MRRVVVILIAVLALLSCSDNDIVSVFPVESGYSWGYINTSGKYVVNPVYDDADYFYCGLAKVVQDDKTGYINSRGKTVVELKYVDGTKFSGGLAFVSEDCEPIKCINTSGKVKFSLDEIERAYPYNEGLARIETPSRKYGFIDTEGRIVIDTVYTEAGHFSEGLVFVSKDDWSGFVDDKGNTVFEVDAYKPYEYKEGLVVHHGREYSDYGYLDKKGKIAIDHQFYGADSFSEGLACVESGYDNYGFINKKGRMVINPQYEQAESFSNGLAVVRKAGKYGYIDTKGRERIKPVYHEAFSFIGDYAFVQGEDYKYGLINKKGKYVVEPQFSDVVHYFGEQNESSARSYKFIGKKFISEFLNRHTDGVWDSIDGSVTALKLMEIYPKIKPNGDRQYYYNTSQEFDNVKLYLVEINFDESTYDLVTRYATQGIFTFNAGLKRKYRDDVMVKAIRYCFKTSWDAYGKEKSIAKTLAAALAEEMNGSVVEEDEIIKVSSQSINETVELTWYANEVYVLVKFG